MEDKTVVQILGIAKDQLNTHKGLTLDSAALREYSLAITAVEDAIMRSNRAFNQVAYGYIQQGDVQSAAEAEGDLY